MSDVSVIIPTISEKVLTRESIPEEVPVTVVRNGTLNEARNSGVRRTNTEKVVILDDDISFSESFFWDMVDRIEPECLIGMEDWNYGFTAGRLMGFTRSTWRAVGGFDERLRSHMGDTDFAIRIHKRGYKLKRIPQSKIDHDGPPGAIERTGILDHAWRGLYLSIKHPYYIPRLFCGMVKPMLNGTI